jgi:hypothetical protein
MCFFMSVVFLGVISDCFTGQLQEMVIVMGLPGDGNDFFHVKLNPF